MNEDTRNTALRDDDDRLREEDRLRDEREEAALHEEAVLRERAVKRLKKRRDFYTHVLVYTLVNAFLVAIWALSDVQFFWPVFPIVGWGIAVVLNAWDTFASEEFDEEKIQREMDRLTRPR